MIKRTVTAISALLLSVILCAAGFYVLNRTCNSLTQPLEELSKYAEQHDSENARKQTEKVLEMWEKSHGKIEALTRHAETDELEKIIKSLSVFVRQNDMERLEEAAQSGINRLEHIVKKELPVLSNIF